MAKAKKRQISREQAVAQLWEVPDLSYMLKGIQQQMRQLVYESKHDISIFLVARQSGKSYTMCTIGTEFCLKNENVKVLLLFPKKKDAARVAKEHMRIILKECPEHLKPEYMVADKTFVFPNGSEIIMAGTDGGSAESIRGSTLHLILMDEAGFHDYNDFRYIVNSVIAPTLTTTNGKIIMASTPSKELDHPFMVDYVVPYREQGWLVEFDISKNPLIDDKMREKIIARYPLGKDDPEYRREYLLETKVADSSMVMPEFFDIKNDVVADSQKPAYYTPYVSCDPAVVDLTGVLFAYHDFSRNVLVIEDELILGGEGERSLTTDDIAAGVRRKEKKNFTHPVTGLQQEVYMRVIDNNLPLLVNDLNHNHGLYFTITKKQDKEDKINLARTMMRDGKIEINPRCVNLISHIETARWNKQRTKFLRSKGNQAKGIKAHHADLFDALIYLVRNFHPHHNPFPPGYGQLSGPNVHNRHVKDEENQQVVAVAKTIMNINN